MMLIITIIIVDQSHDIHHDEAGSEFAKVLEGTLIIAIIAE